MHFLIFAGLLYEKRKKKKKNNKNKKKIKKKIKKSFWSFCFTKLTINPFHTQWPWTCLFINWEIIILEDSAHKLHFGYKTSLGSLQDRRRKKGKNFPSLSRLALNRREQKPNKRKKNYFLNLLSRLSRTEDKKKKKTPPFWLNLLSRLSPSSDKRNKKKRGGAPSTHFLPQNPNTFAHNKAAIGWIGAWQFHQKSWQRDQTLHWGIYLPFFQLFFF